MESGAKARSRKEAADITFAWGSCICGDITMGTKTNGTICKSEPKWQPLFPYMFSRHNHLSTPVPASASFSHPCLRCLVEEKCPKSVQGVLTEPHSCFTGNTHNTPPLFDPLPTHPGCGFKA